MVDSVAVFPPGWRAFNNAGELVTDGVLEFYAAGTSTPLTVYSAQDLFSSLGATVSCNSSGYPVTGANAKTLIYVGAVDYKVRLTSALNGGTVWEHDNARGALDTSLFLTTAAVANKSIVITTTNRTISAADKGKLINANCTSGVITMTFNPSSSLGAGFWCGIRHDGTANQVRLLANGGETFGLNGIEVAAFSLTGRGQVVWVACDGTNLEVDGQVPELIGGGTGVIKIASRPSTPPGSPVAGARYIVNASPTGAWSTYNQNDIAEANGFGGWFRYVPPGAAGWLTYVTDEDTYYARTASGWIPMRLAVGQTANFPTEAIYPGALVAIIQEQQTAGTSGGTSTAGADQIRVLNTLAYSRNSVVTLVSNQFTLPAGSWEISWSAPGYNLDSHQASLYNVTTATILARGTSEFVDQASEDPAQSRSVGIHRVTIATANTYEIRHKSSLTQATNGLGIAGSLGTEIYTQVIVRVA